MYRFKRLAVGITLGDQDEAKIRYAALISRLASSEKIIFVHVVRPSKPPTEGTTPTPDMPDVIHTKKRMEALITTYFDGFPKTALEYEVMEDSPLIDIELLRRFKERDIDLIILGKIRGELTGSGTVPVKVARKVPCSVLFIPEGITPEYAHILVPTDFSDLSHDALDVAVSFAAEGNVSTITCFNTYNVPIGYYKAGKSYEEFAEIMRGHAEKKFDEFVRTVDLRGIAISPVFRLHKNPCKAVEEYVREHYTDFIIMGARGRKTGVRFLMGSMTEKLISSTTMPLLAVKRKGEGMSFLEALLRL